MPNPRPFQPPQLTQTITKHPTRVWEEEIAKAKRGMLNDDGAKFLKHLNLAIKIDLLKTVKFAVELLDTPQASDDLQSSLTASLAARVEAVNAIDPEFAKTLFLKLNRCADSRPLRARLGRVAQKIGMGPKPDGTL